MEFSSPSPIEENNGSIENSLKKSLGKGPIGEIMKGKTPAEEKKTKLLYKIMSFLEKNQQPVDVFHKFMEGIINDQFDEETLYLLLNGDIKSTYEIEQIVKEEGVQKKNIENVIDTVMKTYPNFKRKLVYLVALFILAGIPVGTVMFSNVKEKMTDPRALNQFVERMPKLIEEYKELKGKDNQSEALRNVVSNIIEELSKIEEILGKSSDNKAVEKRLVKIRKTRKEYELELKELFGSLKIVNSF